MPQGLQVFDESGRVVLDTSDRPSIFIDTIKLTTSTNTATLHNDLFVKNTPFFIVDTSASYGKRPTDISLITEHDSLTISATVYEDTTIYIGVY